MEVGAAGCLWVVGVAGSLVVVVVEVVAGKARSEEHTSELQSLS